MDARGLRSHAGRAADEARTRRRGAARPQRSGRAALSAAAARAAAARPRGRIAELQQALANVKELQRLLPICSYCKCIRDDSNYWRELEEYVSAHTKAHFTHGVCPGCLARLTLELH